MITERHSAGVRAGNMTAVRARARSNRSVSLQPALAPWQLLLEKLGQSILTQLMLVMSCIALAALLYLAQASQASVHELNIADLQNQNAQLNGRNADLQAKITALASLQRIDSIAIGRLHMIKPEPSTTVWVNPVFTKVDRVPTRGETLNSAQHSSEPLGEVRHFLMFLISSL